MLSVGIAEEVTSYHNIFYSIHTHHSQLKSWFGVLRCPYVRFQYLLLNSYCKRYFKEFFQRIFCFIQFKAKKGGFETQGVFFVFKTSPSHTYIQLQAQKSISRVGIRRTFVKRSYLFIHTLKFLYRPHPCD